MNSETLITTIEQAFGHNEYPGDAFLIGSTEGTEPEDEVGPFRGHTDWRTLDPQFLDAHYSALSFFSEAGFRFFLPAYLVADVRGALETADPEFHLTHGFSESSIVDRRGEREFVRRWGGATLINPRRYGAATSFDHARYRLSIFTREEAGAIVEYLEWKRDAPTTLEHERLVIAHALARFWRERATSAPTAEMLLNHLREEREYLAALGVISRKPGEE
jgi:hypothetical protein